MLRRGPALLAVALLPLALLFAVAYARQAARVGTRSDLLSFYAAGRTFRSDRERVYDFETQILAQRTLLRELDPSARVSPLPCVYPPFILGVFGALSRLEYFTAYRVVTGVSVLLVLVLGWALLGALGLRGADRAALLLVPFAFAPFAVNNLAGCQLAALGFAVAAAYAIARRAGRDAAAGAALALGLYKPPLFAGVLLLSALDRRRTVLAGYAAGALALAAVSLSLVGPSGLAVWVERLAGFRYGKAYLPGHVLFGSRAAAPYQALHHVAGSAAPLVWIPLAVAAFVAGRRVLRAAPRDSDAALAFELSLSLALSVYFVDYDATILLAPMALVAALRFRGGRGPAFAACGAAAFGLFTEIAYRDAFYARFGFQPLTLWLVAWTAAVGRLCVESKSRRQPA